MIFDARTMRQDMTQQQLMTALEPLVDRSCATDVLLALARVCNEKAEHLRTNWQDKYTAQIWDRLARRIEKVATTEGTTI